VRLANILARRLVLVGTLGGILAGTTPAAALAQNTLRWNFVAGTSLKVKTQQITDHTANGLVVKSEFHVYATWNITAVDPSGAATVGQTIDRITLSMKVPGGDFTYDSSSSEPPTGTVKLLASSFLPPLNKTIELKISPQGRLLQAKWAKPSADTKTANNPTSKAPPNDGELELTRLHGSIAELPENEIAVGDTWVSKHSTSLPTINETMEVENRYTYRGQREIKGKMLDQIDITGQVTIDRGEAGGTSFDVQQQDVQGVILFDSTVGRLVESRLEQQMTIIITTNGQSVTHELAIQTRTEVTPVQAETIQTSEKG
jgi:hypothetical protein